MAKLKDKLAEQIPALREERMSILKGYGDKVMAEVTVAQSYGGMRGVKSMICDTSLVEPEKGLSIRGIPIIDLTDRLPEEILYLLLTGDLPDAEGQDDIKKQFADNAAVPGYVFDVLKAMDPNSHPMAMLSVGVLAMEHESVFRKRYDEGMKKTEYWEPALEDTIRLLAAVTGIAAGIYRIRFNKGELIDPDPNLDWGANYAKMLGLPDPSGNFANLMRLYLVLHSDHEGGNVSANTCHTVGSALSDPYYAVTAGWNGLAGPLHGLANQECLNFVLQIQEKFGGIPTDEQLVQFAWDTLKGGKVIPGYGHAVLRVTDPRFTAFNAFGEKVCSDDPTFAIVNKMFKLIPDVLKEHGKAKSPYPNVDAGSGSLLYHFGLKEFSYYTVLFAVSRAMGILSNLVINRAMGTAITRPKSVGTKWLKDNIIK